MDFQKITFDDDLEDMEADELRGLIREYDDAQSENISEFQQAVESIDTLEGKVAEVEEFDAELTEKLDEISPLDEDELSEFSVTRKRELLTKFAEPEGDEPEGDEGGDEGGEENFSDMGNRGETHGEDFDAGSFLDIAGLE
jgi:hypothetical protein